MRRDMCNVSELFQWSCLLMRKGPPSKGSGRSTHLCRKSREAPHLSGSSVAQKSWLGVF